MRVERLRTDEKIVDLSPEENRFRFYEMDWNSEARDVVVAELRRRGVGIRHFSGVVAVRMGYGLGAAGARTPESIQRIVEGETKTCDSDVRRAIAQILWGGDSPIPGLSNGPSDVGTSMDFTALMAEAEGVSRTEMGKRLASLREALLSSARLHVIPGAVPA